MSTTQSDGTTSVSATDPTTEYRTRPATRSAWPGRILMLVVLAAIVGAGAYGATGLLGEKEQTIPRTMMTHKVVRGPLIVSVIEDGEIESANNINLKCEIAGGSSILWIIEDGQFVKKGEKLVELDSSALEDQISTQTIVFERAKSTYLQAQKNLTVSKQTSLNIGLQLERLASALDDHDLDALQTMAARLRETAAHDGVSEIARKACDLERQVAADGDLLDILQKANELITLCRATNSSFLENTELVADSS